MAFLYLPQGRLEGNENRFGRNFLGIPYAEPPLGDLRFRSPRPCHSFSLKQDCRRFAPIPLQNPRNSHQNENCLFLNVWDPEPQKIGKPVLFFVHGGAFATGGVGKGEFLGIGYDGTLLAKDSGCVVVIPNYRLNVLGFLDFSSFSDAFEPNVGLQDLLMALQWVQENISYFGGDPHNVTLAGQSAGAACIAAIRTMSVAEGLFSKMILESPVLESFLSKEEGRALALSYLKKMGLTPERVGELKTMKARALLKGILPLDEEVRKKTLGVCTFCPVIDGKILKEYPVLSSFQGASKPLLIGTNRDETRFFSFAFPHLGKSLLEKGPKRVPLSRLEEIASHYPNFPSRKAANALFTDLMFAIPATFYADRYAESAPTYVYRFDYAGGVYKLARMGACHLEEVPLLFGWYSIYLLEQKQGKELAERMRRYFGEFARGELDQTKRLPWPRYDSSSRLTMIFANQDTIERDPFRARLSFYSGLTRFY